MSARTIELADVAMRMGGRPLLDIIGLDVSSGCPKSLDTDGLDSMGVL